MNRSAARNPAWRKARANEIQEIIFRKHGFACAECGSGKKLEVDHPAGRDWQPRQLNRYNRWLRYLREDAAGLIRVLCRKCNAKDGRRRQLEAREEEPF